MSGDAIRLVAVLVLGVCAFGLSRSAGLLLVAGLLALGNHAIFSTNWIVSGAIGLGLVFWLALFFGAARKPLVLVGLLICFGVPALFASRFLCQSPWLLASADAIFVSLAFPAALAGILVRRRKAALPAPIPQSKHASPAVHTQSLEPRGPIPLQSVKLSSEQSADRFSLPSSSPNAWAALSPAQWATLSSGPSADEIERLFSPEQLAQLFPGKSKKEIADLLMGLAVSSLLHDYGGNSSSSTHQGGSSSSLRSSAPQSRSRSELRG